MLFETQAAFILAAALALDAAAGDPDWLWRRAPHPVVIFGRLIGWLDRSLNRGSARRLGGVVALIVLIAAAGAAGWALHSAFALHPLGLAGEILAVAVLLAQRSLYDHVARVRRAFGGGGLAAARVAVSLIVGRDPNALDEAGVCRAAIETTAENFSDGVVAPALWYLVAGLPGIAIYKAVNTADSMIGHRTPRHAAFGWASARADDAMNLLPARLSGGLMVVAAAFAGGDARGAWRAMWRDAGGHRSPNAGWPEAAMAGALGLALAGPRVYASGRIEDAWMNEGGRVEARPEDIARALRVFVVACGVLLVVVLAIALMVT
ncbi:MULTISPECIES: adenosylcobinamide-phosphate synthase CbiB [Rhodomicrobium]|uniref:adenosylcobinamide-phosphate synthase CbiB n=1 Tax=Rhodomicrobium TaxID=1068 RepID=UPI000B4A7F8F|nr:MULTISPECIES: adenosylcobinamide-phosphate synthase CbiB [Rhodomicrobium]